MLFESWESVFRVLIVGTAAYLVLIATLRISGKRTLSKMNAFDLVITVALGSTLATVLLDKSTTLAEGIAALALLTFLQYIITWLSVRSPRLQQFVKSEPTILLRDNEYLEPAMRAQRITREEVQAAIRQHGHKENTRIACVILETDGSLSVIAEP